MDKERESAVLFVATLLCKMYGDHEAVACKCEEENRNICHFACDFMDDAERVLDFIDSAPWRSS